MRRTNEQTNPAALTKALTDESARVRELRARFAALTRRLELAEAARGRRDQETDAVFHGAEDSSEPIEFLTENGFSIVRPWETDGSPVPTDGHCRFWVTDSRAAHREIKVEISRRLIAETWLHTGGRIQPSNSFWICCAERHLAEYVWTHDAFPRGDSLLVENLDPEEVILALRWGATSYER